MEGPGYWEILIERRSDQAFDGDCGFEEWKMGPFDYIWIFE